MKKKKIQLVLISWVDAEESAGWSDHRPEDEEVLILHTVGLLVKKTKDWVIHANTYLPDTKLWGGKGKIPRGMVKSIRVIETLEI